MGKPLLRAHLRRRNPRYATPCKRFCSCCGEDNFKPSHLKSKRCLLKTRESCKRERYPRKICKVPKTSSQVKLSKYIEISVCKLHQDNRRVQLKQVTVSITRLSKNVLDVLSEEGSICVGKVSDETACRLGPSSKSGENVGLVSPRRLRSTPVQPVVQRNFMDRLRELNADWRSTAHPLTAFCNPACSSEASDNIREPEFSIKTLFLENLSICKKTPSHESIKENVKMSQDENRASLINQQQNSIKKFEFIPFPRFIGPMTASASRPPSQLTFQSKVVPMDSRSYRSLLGKRAQKHQPGKYVTMSSMGRQKCRSLLSKPTSTSPAPLKEKDVPTVPRVSSTPPKDPPSPPQKSKSKPTILGAGSKKDVRNETAHKPSFDNCVSKNKPSTSKLNVATQDEKPKGYRRKQSFLTRSPCSDFDPSSMESGSMVSKFMYNLLKEDSSKRNNATGNASCDTDLADLCTVDDMCSAPKKQKIAPETPVDSKRTISPSSHRRNREKSCVLENLEKTQETLKESEESAGVFTIVLSDSSEDESIINKPSPTKSNVPVNKTVVGKRTPVRKPALQRNAISKLTSESHKGKSRSNANVNKSKIPPKTSLKPVPESNIPIRRSSLRNSRNVRSLTISSSESEELSSDSEVDTPRYVSRTGRSVGISSGCRSCPGCKIDVRKDKPTPRPARKKKKSEPKPKKAQSNRKPETEDDAYMDTVRVSSVEPIEDSCCKTGSPITIIVEGLNSSESGDELVKEDVQDMLKQAKKVVSNDITDELKDSAATAKHIPQASEKQTLKTLSSTDLDPPKLTNFPGKYLSHGGSSSCAPIPATPERKETENPITDIGMTDAEGSEFNQPGSVRDTLDIHCYVSHYDSNGKVSLSAVESSEDDNVSCEYTEAQKIENSRDDVYYPLLAGDSSETSENSSALANYDSHEYTESESSGTSLITPVDSSQGLDGLSKGLESDLQNHTVQKKSCTAHEDESVADAKECLENLAIEHGSVLENVTEICHETQNCLVNAPLDIHISGDNVKPQSEVTFGNHHSKRSDAHGLDSFNTGEGEREHISQDDVQSMDDPASGGNMSSWKIEPTTLEVSSVSQEVLNLPETPEEALLVPPDATEATHSILPSHQDDGTLNINEDLTIQKSGPVCDDIIIPGEVTSENSNTPLAISTSPRSAILCDTRPSVEEFNTLHENSKHLHDSSVEIVRKSGVVENDTSELSTQGCLMSNGGNKLLEILLLEGCPSCQGEDIPNESSPHASQDSSAKSYNACQDSVNTNKRDHPESSSSLDSSMCEADARAQDGNFYGALSSLLIECLNNVVEAVKLNNREVIIKKADPALVGNAQKTDAHQAGLDAEDLAAIVQELNLSVSLNPRLTIKKLPLTPRERKSPSDNASANSQDIDSLSGKIVDHSEDHQVPEKFSTVPHTPTKRLYERKGYPTPIKRLNPRVLSVIKYNDLDIYNDEPSLNDPPESDCLVCVSSKGVRFKLNPEELANIENFLNDVHDKSSAPSETAVASFEIDDLVIYNDEPPLNPIQTRSLKYPLSENGEDVEDLVIDNDAPSLNEAVEVEADSKPGNDSECMVISSDDEVMMDSETLAASQSELVLGPTVNCVAKEPVTKPRRKALRKRRNSPKPVGAPRVADLLKSQMPYFVDPHEYSRNLVASPTDDIIIDDVIGNVVKTPLPSFQSCREVLHQPQVFNHEGQPLLLGAAKKAVPSSSKNVFSTSQVTFDLSKAFKDATKSVSISDSDTLTPSECDDVVLISPPKTPSSSVNRKVFSYKNGCDTKGIVQSVDTDSDDDVVVTSGPDFNPVNNRSLNCPTPVIPSPAVVRNVGIQQSSIQQTIQQTCTQQPTNVHATTNKRARNNLPTHVKSVRTANGQSYYVVVVPPNNPRVNNIQVYPTLQR